MYMTSEREQRAFEQFLNGYLNAALILASDRDDENMPLYLEQADISPEFMEEARHDCWSFLTGEHGDSELTEIINNWQMSYNSHAGNDFWLTRNGHGAGFWDGDWDFSKNGGEDLGDRLTDRADRFPEVRLYMGDDRLLYGE